MTNAQFRGHIDFETAGSRPSRVAGSPQIIGPGIAVHGDAGAMLAIDGSRIAVTTGSPRFDRALTALPNDATRWLAQWERLGPRAPAGVGGTYAVVLVDLRARTALLATDRFSIQPLCYAFDGRHLRFSDRASCVLPREAQEIDPQGIYDYLYFHVIPAPKTIFRNVLRLREGHVCSIEAGVGRQTRHWSPIFREATDTPLPKLAEEFRSLLRHAVTSCATDPDVGSFLSGGTDSSTIAGLLGDVSGAPARTFSIGFDVAGYDELEYARIAARHFRTEQHEYYLTPRDLIDDIPRVAEWYDQPFGNSSALAAYSCAKMARQCGVRVLLAGDGGDELFGGNSRYAKQRLFAMYQAVPGWLRSGLIEPILLGAPGIDRVGSVRKAASYVRQARVPMPDRMETYNLLMRIGIEHVFEPEFIESVSPSECIELQRSVFAETDDAAFVNRMLAYDWKFTLADNDLPKVVATTRLAGVDVRFPLLCDELVDFSLRLRPELKVRGLKLRYFFKEALRGFLPDEIIAKKKHGFGLPFGAWLVRDPALRAFAADAIDRLSDRGVFRREFLRSLLDVRVPEHPGYYGEMVWILVMLSSWLHAHENVQTHEDCGTKVSGWVFATSSCR